MNYLRYSSDEMFSSTELIRKSKTIFDKLNKNEIEKAIILRDGKPGFMLLDFATYERIMKDYEKLTTKADKKIEEQYLSLDDIEVTGETKKVKVVKETVAPTIELEDKIIAKAESITEEVTQIDDIPSDEINEEELLKALAEIDKINISDDVEEKEKDDFEDDFEVLLTEIKEEKEQPLKEFWDN